MRRALVASVLVVGITVVFFGMPSSCADRIFFAPVEGFALHEPDARYEQLFPYYVELCAVSQLRPRAEDLPSGGSPGHAAMYLKGACLDTDAPYPRLRRCARNETDPDDPEHGAGISVNRWLRNVNWVAVSGPPYVLRGRLEPGELVTQARARADRATRPSTAGIFRVSSSGRSRTSRPTGASSTSCRLAAPAPISPCASPAPRSAEAPGEPRR